MVLMLFWNSVTRPLAHMRRGESGIKKARIVVKMERAKPKKLMYSTSLDNCQKMTV